MIGSADVVKNIFASWNGSGLDALFTAYWDPTLVGVFPVLVDREQAPTGPMPYCVLEISASTGTIRSTSAETNYRREIRVYPVSFTVQARAFASSKSAKAIAQELAEEITKVFGGHPTVAPTAGLALDNGGLIQISYQNDIESDFGEQEHAWQVQYNFTADSPVRDA